MALREVVEQYGDYLYHVAFIYTKDRFVAEEIVQDAFFKYYHSKFEQRASIKTYLTRITINCCYDYMKKWSVKKQQFIEAVTGSGKDAEEQTIANNERQEILQVILTLPLKYREVIFLYYYDDLSADEVGAILHIPSSTVRTRLQRARQKLKNLLTEQEWEVLRHG